MNLKTFFIEKLLKMQHCDLIINGVTVVTAEQVQAEIARRIEIARNGNRDLFYKYQGLGLI